MNDQIDKGLVSEDTAYWFNLMLILFKSSPLFVVVGLITFLYERAVGTNISVKLFYSYEVVLLVGLMVSAYLVFAVGCTEDQMLDWIMKNSPFGHVGMGYQDQSDLIKWLIPFIYIGCGSIGILASVLMMLFPVLKQNDNTVIAGDDYVTGYSLQQMQR